MRSPRLAKFSGAIAACRMTKPGRCRAPSSYTDPDMLALEKEHLFLREWVCVGRAEEVARPGDYVAFQVCDEPIIIVHGDDGHIRAFSNVCRHRGARIRPRLVRASQSARAGLFFEPCCADARSSRGDPERW